MEKEGSAVLRVREIILYLPFAKLSTTFIVLTKLISCELLSNLMYLIIKTFLTTNVEGFSYLSKYFPCPLSFPIDDWKNSRKQGNIGCHPTNLVNEDMRNMTGP